MHSGHKAKLNEVLNEIKFNSKLYLICISCCALIFNNQFIYYIYNHLIRLNFSTLILSTVQACLQSELAPLHTPPPPLRLPYALKMLIKRHTLLPMQAPPCCKLQLHNEVVTRTVAIFCCCSLWTRLAFSELKHILLACLFAVYPLAVRLVLRIVAMLGSLCSRLPASHDLPDSADFPFCCVAKRAHFTCSVCVCVSVCCEVHLSVHCCSRNYC